MRLVLAEPLTLIRAALGRLIEANTRARVIGEAGDGQQLLEQTAKHRPDLVITDSALGNGMNGLEVLAQIRRHYPEVAVLLLSAQADAYLVRQALRLGALGCLSKTADLPELPLALQSVEKGQIYLSPCLAHFAFERRMASRQDEHVELTPRQRQVLQLIARGKSTKEIAALLGVSIKTVETHRMRLMQSLGLIGTNALMRFAIRQGFDTGTP